MRAAYLFRDQLLYANRKPGESPADAVARSLSRRVGAPVTMWPGALDDMQRETFKAQWFDSAACRNMEETVRIDGPRTTGS